MHMLLRKTAFVSFGVDVGFITCCFVQWQLFVYAFVLQTIGKRRIAVCGHSSKPIPFYILFLDPFPVRSMILVVPALHIKQALWYISLILCGRAAYIILLRTVCKLRVTSDQPPWLPRDPLLRLGIHKLYLDMSLGCLNIVADLMVILPSTY
jgi:hypothetical protein